MSCWFLRRFSLYIPLLTFWPLHLLWPFPIPKGDDLNKLKSTPPEDVFTCYSFSGKIVFEKKDSKFFLCKIFDPTLLAHATPAFLTESFKTRRNLKNTNIFSIIQNCLPSEESLTLHFNKLWSPSHNNALCHV